MSSVCGTDEKIGLERLGVTVSDRQRWMSTVITGQSTEVERTR